MKKYFSFLIILILSFFTFYRLLRSGFWSMQDDMHVFRLQQLDLCFEDGQIPCRYIPDGGFGYGYPLFNYYSPFVYYFAQNFHLLGFSLINSLKITFLLSNLTAVLGMFLLSSHFWGNSGAIIATTLFVFAPYRATDFYVRGALAEFTALNLLPLLFWSYLQPISLITVIVTTIFLLSHNLFALTAIPLLILFILLRKRFNKIILLLASLSLSAFFLVPAILEKNLVTVATMTQGYFDYKAHFTTLAQLFLDRSWGFGASLWGPKDDMSFQVGIVHWLIPLLLFIFTFIKPNKFKLLNLIRLCLILGLFFLFLTHNKSSFIWQLLPFMPYFQFPWRFIGFAVFFFSFASGAVIQFFSNKKLIFSLLTAILIVLLNFNYFKEDIWYPGLTDQQKLSPSEIIRQSGAGLKDYWPVYGQTYPKSYAPYLPQSAQPIKIISYTKKSNLLKAEIESELPNTVVTFPLVNFPDWLLTINHNFAQYSLQPELGLIQVTLQPGYNYIELNLTNSPVRLISNAVSFFTFFSLLFYYLKLCLLKRKSFLS